MIVRNYEQSDHCSLSKIYLDARIKGFPWVDKSQLHLGDFTRDTVNEEILVGQWDNLIVGFVSYEKQTRFIHNLYVNIKYFRKGFGEQLLSAAINHLEKPITLKCQKQNESAFHFYLANGWRAIGSGSSGVGEYHLMELAE